METQIEKSSLANESIVADPNNDFLSIQVGTDARYNSGATGLVTGVSYNISYDWPGQPGTSFTTIRIDGTDSVYGTDGTMVQAPTELPNLKNEAIWQYGNIDVKQTLQIVFNGATGRVDTGMYKYTVTNNDTVAHSVGIRNMIDTMLNSNDGAPFRIPGVGAVTTEMEFLSASIPQYWQAFYSLANPDILAQGNLIGGDATTPDRFVIAAWPRIQSTLWDYTVDPSISVTSDSAVAVYWNPVVINPGESRDFVTFYGLATLSGNTDLSITGPSQLSIVNNAWSPNPFTVTAYITNNTGSDMTNVPVTLSLPAGLGFAPGETATHIILSIASGTTEQTSWSVEALTDGTWTYSVTALNQTVSRTVVVPPLQTLQTRGLIFTSTGF